jgi:hypothetical protein
MIIYYGTRLFGKVDQIDGTDIHVATKFFHIWFIPLIPLGSTLVLSKTDDGWRGLPHPFSFKSLLVTWGRLACLPGVAIGIGACVDDEVLIGVPIIIASIAFFIGSYFLFVARGKRKEELLAMIGLGAEEPVAAAAPAPAGPLLVRPEVGHAKIAEAMAVGGLQQVAAPPGALAMFSHPRVNITVRQGPIGIVALEFAGPEAAGTQRAMADLIPHLGQDDVAWLLSSHDPAQAHAGVSAAMAMQLHGLRPSVERLSMHPDPNVRAEAQRALGVLQPAY